MIGKIRELRNRTMFRGSNINFDNFHDDDAVAIFPRLRLVYNRIKKSGNTTITIFLAELDDPAFFEKRARRAIEVREIKARTLKPLACTTRQLLKIKGYRYFSCVRNPYTRVLSAFLDKVASRPMAVEGGNTEPQVPGWGMPTREGFANFLEFLESGGLYRDRHWWPQSDLLIRPPEEFDFIARLEHLAEDMARFLPEIGMDASLAKSLDRPHTLEQRQRKGQNRVKIQNAKAKEPEFYDDKLRRVVVSLYEQDFRNFGYSPEQP